MKRNKEKINLSIVLPAYNEENNIENSICAAIKILDEVADNGEIIAINDGSTDKTGMLLDRLSKYNGILRVMHHSKNMGMGNALMDGFREAKYEFIFYTDFDNQFDFNDLKLMLPLIREADIIAGYREKRCDPLIRILVSSVYNFFIKIIFDLGVKDINCAFKLFKKSTFEKININSSSFFINAQILINAAKMNFIVKQVPVRHSPRLLGRSKVRFRDIFYVFRDLLVSMNLSWRAD